MTPSFSHALYLPHPQSLVSVALLYIVLFIYLTMSKFDARPLFRDTTCRFLLYIELMCLLPSVLFEHRHLDEQSVDNWSHYIHSSLFESFMGKTSYLYGVHIDSFV